MCFGQYISKDKSSKSKINSKYKQHQTCTCQFSYMHETERLKTSVLFN